MENKKGHILMPLLLLISVFEDHLLISNPAACSDPGGNFILVVLRQGTCWWHSALVYRSLFDQCRLGLNHAIILEIHRRHLTVRIMAGNAIIGDKIFYFFK